MIDPVELIGKARIRLAFVAAARAALYPVAPGVTAIVLAIAVGPANDLMLARWGVALSPAILAALRGGLIAAAILAAAAAAVAATIAYRHAGDFVAAAERVDATVNARQEVLTFATLTDPSRPQDKSLRSGLFPLLWRRTAERLERFDPDRTFGFDVAAPVRRGSALALAIVAILGLAMMALVRPPTPQAAEAHRLREIARAIEASPGDSAARVLAASMRAAAGALENPSLPPEEKLKMIAELTHALAQNQPQPKSAAGSKSQSARGNSSGKGDSGKGEGSASGEGSSNGQGSGKGENKNAPGTGNGEKKGQTQIAELQEELSKTKNQIESESAPKDKSIPKPAPAEQPGTTLAPGQKPNQPGAANQPTNTSGNKIAKPGENAAQTEKSGEGGMETAKNDKGSTKGDTRLGEFPAPVRYERFYKPGEHGPPVEIRDARYVRFRLPTAPPVAGAGKTVLDTERPSASTPYANVPLKEQNLAATPDERQQIPPRYRDLIQ